MISKKYLNHILLMGPFPPPTHGFAVATDSLYKYLKKDNLTINFSLSSNFRNILLLKADVILRATLAIFKIIYFALHGGKKISIGCNGGLGLIFTSILLIVSGVIKGNVCLHHHSYNYITKKSLLMLFITKLKFIRLKHIFLSKTMVANFKDHYQLDNYDVISNAYFVPAKKNLLKKRDKLTIGLISNLSKEKGLYNFLNLVKTLSEESIEFKALLAGPVPLKEDRIAIKGIEDSNSNLNYIGPVYDDDKDNFFKNIDLFVFPSEYSNEAQPIVIYEAMAYGIPTISVNIGCIKDQVSDNKYVFKDNKQFNIFAPKLIKEYFYLPDTIKEQIQLNAYKKLNKDMQRGKISLDNLFS